MTETITFYAKRVTVETDDVESSQVTVSGYDLDDLLANFSAKEVLESLTAQDKFSSIVDYVEKEVASDE